MLELRPLTTADGEAAYMFLQAFAPDENGFENPYRGCSKETFLPQELPLILDHAQGRNLKENYVPETWYFLWDDDQMVGLFRIRHYLTEALAQGAGHIGYGIHPDHRGKGYATRGLALAVEEAAKLIPEDEVYLSCHKDNPASLRMKWNIIRGFRCRNTCIVNLKVWRNQKKHPSVRQTFLRILFWI